jgi:hypothetical protein
MQAAALSQVLAVLLAVVLTAPSEADQQADRVTEFMFRHLATLYCTEKPCYITVDEKRPSDSMLKRLGSVPKLLAVPAGGFTVRNRPQPYSFLVDVGPLKFLSDGRAQVPTSVGGIGGPQVFVCTYYLHRLPKGWGIQDEETSCAIT